MKSNKLAYASVHFRTLSVHFRTLSGPFNTIKKVKYTKYKKKNTSNDETTRIPHRNIADKKQATRKRRLDDKCSKITDGEEDSSANPPLHPLQEFCGVWKAHKLQQNVKRLLGPDQTHPMNSKFKQTEINSIKLQTTGQLRTDGTLV